MLLRFDPWVTGQ
jgi:hypothetical protein